MSSPWRRVLDGIARQLRDEDRPAPRQDATPSFTCPRCTRTSHSAMDVRYGYCSPCHDYTGVPTP